MAAPHGPAYEHTQHIPAAVIPAVRLEYLPQGSSIPVNLDERFHALVNPVKLSATKLANLAGLAADGGQQPIRAQILHPSHLPAYSDSNIGDETELGLEKVQSFAINATFPDGRGGIASYHIPPFTMRILPGALTPIGVAQLVGDPLYSDEVNSPIPLLTTLFRHISTVPANTAPVLPAANSPSRDFERQINALMGVTGKATGWFAREASRLIVYVPVDASCERYTRREYAGNGTESSAAALNDQKLWQALGDYVDQGNAVNRILAHSRANPAHTQGPLPPPTATFGAFNGSYPALWRDRLAQMSTSFDINLFLTGYHIRYPTDEPDLEGGQQSLRNVVYLGGKADPRSKYQDHRGRAESRRGQKSQDVRATALDLSTTHWSPELWVRHHASGAVRKVTAGGQRLPGRLNAVFAILEAAARLGLLDWMDSVSANDRDRAAAGQHPPVPVVTQQDSHDEYGSMQTTPTGNAIELPDDLLVEHDFSRFITVEPSSSEDAGQPSMTEALAESSISVMQQSEEVSVTEDLEQPSMTEDSGTASMIEDTPSDTALTRDAVEDNARPTPDDRLCSPMTGDSGWTSSPAQAPSAAHNQGASTSSSADAASPPPLNAASKYSKLRFGKVKPKPEGWQDPHAVPESKNGETSALAGLLGRLGMTIEEVARDAGWDFLRANARTEGEHEVTQAIYQEQLVYLAVHGRMPRAGDFLPFLRFSPRSGSFADVWGSYLRSFLTLSVSETCPIPQEAWPYYSVSQPLTEVMARATAPQKQVNIASRWEQPRFLKVSDFIQYYYIIERQRRPQLLMADWAERAEVVRGLSMTETVTYREQARSLGGISHETVSWRYSRAEPTSNGQQGISLTIRHPQVMDHIVKEARSVFYARSSALGPKIPAAVDYPVDSENWALKEMFSESFWVDREEKEALTEMGIRVNNLIIDFSLVTQAYIDRPCTTLQGADPLTGELQLLDLLMSLVPSSLETLVIRAGPNVCPIVAVEAASLDRAMETLGWQTQSLREVSLFNVPAELVVEFAALACTNVTVLRLHNFVVGSGQVGGPSLPINKAKHYRPESSEPTFSKLEFLYLSCDLLTAGQLAGSDKGSRLLVNAVTRREVNEVFHRHSEAQIMARKEAGAVNPGSASRAALEVLDHDGDTERTYPAAVFFSKTLNALPLIYLQRLRCPNEDQASAAADLRMSWFDPITQEILGPVEEEALVPASRGTDKRSTEPPAPSTSRQTSASSASTSQWVSPDKRTKYNASWESQPSSSSHEAPGSTWPAAGSTINSWSPPNVLGGSDRGAANRGDRGRGGRGRGRGNRGFRGRGSWS